MYTRKRVTCLFFLTLGLLGMVSSAYAVDKKTFPGSTCQVEYSAPYTGPQTSSSWQYWGGAYGNTAIDDGAGGNYDHVICPILRDNTGNFNGIKQVKVRGYSSGLGRGMYCELQTTNSFGGASSTGAIGFPLPMQSIHLDFPAGFSEKVYAGTISSNGGYFYLHCEVPPDSYIYGYEAVEY